ncbi:MAG: ABC transporter ATP-binding protein [Flavobacterium sp.]|nr:ABC transporter ATP-binding protein [Flavobacterium sp.]
MSFLCVTDIFKKNKKGFELVKANFTQAIGQKIAIAGETGSGKSTLLKIIAGLEQPDSGTILFEGKKVMGPLYKLIPGHSGIAYLSQQFELPNFLTVEQVLIYANPLWDQEAEKDENAKALYKMCRIDHLLKRRTDELSGGEKQRVALAKLIISAPRLLLLDEPFSNLDMIHKNVLKDVILDLSEQLNISCIIISHDPLDTLSWADDIIVMHNGKIIQHDTPYHIYTQPTDAYTAGLFGKYNTISTKLAASLATILKDDAIASNTFLRPDNFIITNSNEPSFKGVVTASRYFGSYQEIDIIAFGEAITIKTNIANAKTGDFLNITYR